LIVSHKHTTNILSNKFSPTKNKPNTKSVTTNMKKNAVITGATKGIGLAIAQKLASEGYNLAICARNQSDLDKMKTTFTQSYPDCQVTTLKTDVSIKEEIQEFAQLIKANFSTIDVLVNNAGVFIPGELAHEEDGMLEKMMQTNLYSAYNLTRLLLPNMTAQQQGYIFNICSVASIKAYPNGGSYSISKFALLGFSKVLREELKNKGIKVTAILPGATWSDSWSGVDLPQSRLMQATDIAEAISSALKMSKSAVIEEIIIRPQLGDL
jgi:short-subunit dehydrogenase